MNVTADSAAASLIAARLSRGRDPLIADAAVRINVEDAVRIIRLRGMLATSGSPGPPR